jgi:hypothetical protein
VELELCDWCGKHDCVHCDDCGRVCSESELRETAQTLGGLPIRSCRSCAIASEVELGLRAAEQFLTYLRAAAVRHPHLDFASEIAAIEATLRMARTGRAA